MIIASLLMGAKTSGTSSSASWRRRIRQARTPAADTAQYAL